MKKILIIIMAAMIISLVGAVDYEIIDYKTKQMINETTNETYRVTDTGSSPKIRYYSTELNETLEYRIEGTDKFNACKQTSNDELFDKVGNLNFNCTGYTDYEDYVQNRMQQTNDYRVNPPISSQEEILNRLTALEEENADLKSRLNLLETLKQPEVITGLSTIGLILVTGTLGFRHYKKSKEEEDK